MKIRDNKMNMKRLPMKKEDGREYPSSDAPKEADEEFEKLNDFYAGCNGKHNFTYEELEEANKPWVKMSER